ncbi:polysaccharide deacetylase family protein [Radiobacillus kanasensis]|uniref:polysaccharide deacetylase family protein n=1 Tax=Radiobacillus kanasensis TaxID=2844358 RepID=UPI001E2B4B7E|nr:polysaccharide deacetylase family protein [Radiobacillus kanasensis]UFU00887.1 polysaccharide deacetylase family protein [Radiobacillus kanasensis]
MKQFLWILCILALLTACQETTVEKEKVSTTAPENETVVEKKEAPKNLLVTQPVEPQYYVAESWSIIPLDEATNSKVALLTIDDAPDTYAVEMAKTLKALNAPAIFFVNGHFLDTDEEKQKLKQIYDMGFVIGNHTYNHSNLNDLSEEQQKEEIVSVSNIVEEVTGKKPKFFRAPFGMNTDYSKQVVKEQGMVLMNWTYGYDWDQNYMTEDAIADIMVNAPELRDGANLLMHDREWTAAAIDNIVNGLREKGYEIVDPQLIQTNPTE